jgi:negative regulator of flagellin synthesis FlgM
MTSVGPKVHGYAADTASVGIQEQLVSNRIKGSMGGPIEGGGTRAVERVRGTAATRPASQPADSPTDSVHITESARQLLALQKAIAEVPDVNAARVEQLRAAIEQKTYSVDSGKIADRLLGLEGDLLASSRPGKN